MEILLWCFITLLTCLLLAYIYYLLTNKEFIKRIRDNAKKERFAEIRKEVEEINLKLSSTITIGDFLKWVEKNNFPKETPIVVKNRNYPQMIHLVKSAKRITGLIHPNSGTNRTTREIKVIEIIT